MGYFVLKYNEMITVAYCTRKPNPEHSEHIKNTSGVKNIEVIEYVNNGESLTKVYNQLIKEAKYEIIVLCHDDILLMNKNWGSRIINHFKRHKDLGILGVAGSKSLPSSAKWWENPKTMYGRVHHTHEGKTWLSAYSKDLGNQIDDVVLVDGLFFAIYKDRIKKDFDETVEGFHFYDVDFCFRNYLDGVRIGVCYDVRVNHMSIGKTNDEWENNRVMISKKYESNLPVLIPKVFGPSNKLKVLIGCLNFNGYTGSELYVFELAKQLIKQNCDVTICSNIGEPLLSLAHRMGVKMYDLQNPPGYKMGDGKWGMDAPTGFITSEPNKLYKTGEVDFDIIHLNHKPVTEHLIRLYPNIPIVCGIHSEVISLEEPVISPLIKGYIAIRPEIKEYIKNKFYVPEELISVIYNPIDTDRFRVNNNNKKRDKKRILFVGTIDYLRREMIEDLISTTRELNQELWILGKKNENYLDEMLVGQTHVTYHEATRRVEDFIHQCDETAGILLGRTTIEGWLCGKPGWIYDIDNGGRIISKALHEVPNDVNKFSGESIVKEIITLYTELINKI